MIINQNTVLFKADPSHFGNLPFLLAGCGTAADRDAFSIAQTDGIFRQRVGKSFLTGFSTRKGEDFEEFQHNYGFRPGSLIMESCGTESGLKIMGELVKLRLKSGLTQTEFAEKSRNKQQAIL
ncbi:MAG: hypothetical protein LBU32_13640 [Clostridiales bacterium]|jgi:hypothetical protein|nr:hypothetical protein [Clostridiales bacterium]